MNVKDLIANGIKKIINQRNIDKREAKIQKNLTKQEHINKLKRIDEYEREQKYNNLIERENKRENIKNMKKRINSSCIYRLKSLKNQHKKDIYKIQKILKNGEGKDEENLDILLEEFPDNPRIDEIIKQYQIKKILLKIILK